MALDLAPAEIHCPDGHPIRTTVRARSIRCRCGTNVYVRADGTVRTAAERTADRPQRTEDRTEDRPQRTAAPAAERTEDRTEDRPQRTAAPAAERTADRPEDRHEDEDQDQDDDEDQDDEDQDEDQDDEDQDDEDQDDEDQDDDQDDDQDERTAHPTAERGQGGPLDAGEGSEDQGATWGDLWQAARRRRAEARSARAARAADRPAQTHPYADVLGW